MNILEYEGGVVSPEELGLYLLYGELWHLVGGGQLIAQALALHSAQQGLTQVPGEQQVVTGQGAGAT